MGIGFSTPALIAHGGQTYTMGALLSVSADALPQYLILTGLDRERYTAASTGERGTISGNGQTAAFIAPPGSDSYSLGLLFTYTPQGYYNDTYGYLDALAFHSSADNGRNAYLSLYGFGSAGQAEPALLAKLQADLANPYFNGEAFMVAGSADDPLAYTRANFLGTLDVVTRAGYVDASPGQATPDEIAAIATSFVGQVWNDNGCWILASNIAAMAGASLPLTSDEARPGLTPPVANGEWIVAYDSTQASSAARPLWQSQLRVGDIVVTNNSCGGHILTVVGGAGYAALFIDNSGVSAADGSAHDIVIEGAHSMVSWALGPDPDNVVIYRLDAPQIAIDAPLCLRSGDASALAPLLSVSDPAGRAITGYQVYHSGGGALLLGDAVLDASSAGNAATLGAAELAGLAYRAGSAGDSITLRAFNGSYWGDWQTLAVTVGNGVAAPVLHAAAATVFVHGGHAVSLDTLLAGVDPSVTSYTISSPSNGGTILLNGAENQLGTGPGNPNGDQRYQVAAADLARLTYVAPSYQGAETIVLSANNGAAAASMPLTVTMTTVAPATHAVAHWVALGAEVPVSSLFTVTLSDATPLTSYAISTNVTIIDWQGTIPSHGGALALNGATDLLANADVPPGFYEVPVADIDKVTFHAALDAGVALVDIRANDGAGGSPALITLTTVAEPSPLSAHGATLAPGETVAAASLFTLSGPAHPYYRLTDPGGAGALQLAHDATNLQNKGDSTPGVYILAAAELDKLSYTAGTRDASEWLTVSVSDDMQHWSAEAFIQMGSVAARRQLAGTSGDDSFELGSQYDVVDAGAGLDTAIVHGLRSQFSLAHGSAGWRLADLGGAQGIDQLNGVERLRFDDQSVALDLDGAAGRLFGLYRAAFDRMPDAGGFGWWLNQIDHGAAPEQVAQAFIGSDEFVRQFGSGLSDADYAMHIYENAMHRTPDDGSLASLLDALDSGTSRAALLLDLASHGEFVTALIGQLDAGFAYAYAGA